MPSPTPRAAVFMAAIAHGWRPDRVKAPPLAVAQEFNRADKGGATLRAGMRALALRRRAQEHRP